MLQIQAVKDFYQYSSLVGIVPFTLESSRRILVMLVVPAILNLCVRLAVTAQMGPKRSDRHYDAC